MFSVAGVPGVFSVPSLAVSLLQFLGVCCVSVVSSVMIALFVAPWDCFPSSRGSPSTPPAPLQKSA